MPGLLASLPSGFEFKVRERFHAARHVGLRASQLVAKASLRLLTLSWRLTRRVLDAVLLVFERVLLSPAGRERVHAIATFALIFLFAVTSVDFLVSGGPEFGAPARSQPPSVVQTAPPAAPAARAEAAAPTEVAASLAETRAATIVQVSQSFEPPIVRSAETADLAVAAGQSPLVGEPAEQAEPIASLAIRERKRKLSGR